MQFNHQKPKRMGFVFAKRLLTTQTVLSTLLGDGGFSFHTQNELIWNDCACSLNVPCVSMRKLKIVDVITHILFFLFSTKLSCTSHTNAALGERKKYFTRWTQHKQFSPSISVSSVFNYGLSAKKERRSEEINVICTGKRSFRFAFDWMHILCKRMRDKNTRIVEGKFRFSFHKQKARANVKRMI